MDILLFVLNAAALDFFEDYCASVGQIALKAVPVMGSSLGSVDIVRVNTVEAAEVAVVA